MTDETIGDGTVSGTTTINDSQDFEVALLAIEAVLKIGDRIATDIDAVLGNRLQAGTKALLVLGDETLLADLAGWRAISTQFDLIEEAMKAAMPARLQGGIEGVAETEAAVGQSEGMVATALSSIGAGLAALSNVMSYFNADTTYTGRAVELDQSMLVSALVRSLTRKDWAAIGEVRIGAIATAAGRAPAGIVDLAARLSRLDRRCRALESQLPATAEAAQPEPIDAAPADTLLMPETEAETDDAMVALAQDQRPPAPPVETAPHLARIRALLAAGNRLLTKFLGLNTPAALSLQATSRLAGLLASQPGAYLLSSKSIKSGGHYRIRQTLLSRLWLGDQLSYSGGAAISYVLTDLQSGRTVLADVLYHSSGEVRLPKIRSVAASSNAEPMSSVNAIGSGPQT